MVRETRVGRSPRGRNPSIRVQIPASPYFSRRTALRGRVRIGRRSIGNDHTVLPDGRGDCAGSLAARDIRHLTGLHTERSKALSRKTISADRGLPCRSIVAVEYAHRLLAALTSLFILLTMAFAVLWHRTQTPIVTLSVMTFAVLVAQVWFGALTITSSLDWVVVTIHLALGTATLALALMVALMALRLQTGAAPPEPSAG